MHSNVLPFATDSDTHTDKRGTCDPMPETMARRAVKYHKSDIVRLKRQIQVEQKRIALQRTVESMKETLRDLRTK